MTRNSTALTVAVSSRLDTSVTPVDCPAADDTVDAAWTPAVQPEVIG